MKFVAKYIPALFYMLVCIVGSNYAYALPETFSYKDSNVSTLPDNVRDHIDYIRRKPYPEKSDTNTNDINIKISYVYKGIQAIKLMNAEECDGEYCTTLILLDGDIKFSLQKVSKIEYNPNICLNSRNNKSNWSHGVGDPCIVVKLKIGEAIILLKGKIASFWFLP